MYYAVIMAGGSGTRLWPLSRQNMPKQAIRLVGERSMFQHAVDRLHPLFPPERILVVTRAEHALILREQSPQLPAENFIVEPEGRGTAPAIGLAAVHLQQRDPQAVMAVLTADHFIADLGAFQQSLRAAERVAQDGFLVTLGIQPSGPATGFGYIEQGAALGHAFRVARFVEKPDLETAKRMIARGDYSWNSGMFIWRVERIMEEFARQMPAFSAQLDGLRGSIDAAGYPAALAALWPQVAKQTIDYGVMEGARDVAVLPVEIGWSDIGSWASLYDVIAPDADGNHWTGPHIAIDTHDSLVYNQNRLVATIGVEGLVIVDTPEALLVCPREREQEVRNLVAQLKEKHLDQWL
jgi:mannose-1-phosphate guanylyltransferase